MGTGLLQWGGGLFLLRLELGQLQIHRIDVDAKEKKVSLVRCSVQSDSDAAALLADARLVAAKEVEDTTSAIRYPVLVFQILHGAKEASTTSSSPVSRKRRRSTKDKETCDADGEVASSQSRAGTRLLFCLLYETETAGEMGLRALNELECPTLTGESGGELATVDCGASLQVYLADGPYVLLFERGSRMATVLKWQMATWGGAGVGFCIWREHVDVMNGIGGDTSALSEMVSCTYISEAYCTRPHLLIHVQRLQPSSSIDSRESHSWTVLDVEEEQEQCGERRSTECRYLPAPTECSGALSKLEQITCCCFISELNEWDFSAPPSTVTSSFTHWAKETVSWATITDTSVSTLVVTGTSSNTIHVHTNGVLLASYVLSAQPAEMWCMCEESSNKRYVLGIRCNDVSRSFFMLGFSSNLDNATFELLLSFNHVGHAYVGDFIRGHASTNSQDQVLLLNEVPGISGSNSCGIASDVGLDRGFEDGQLVKRSVLITQKVATPEVKFACHRLRLREGKKSKHGSRPRKRSRNNEKESAKGDHAGSKTQPFLYIERTQKASSRDRSAIRPEDRTDGVESAPTASHAQLAKLTDSLTTRLDNGLKELERLQMIVNDKCRLARQLNQLIIREWRQQQETAHSSKEKSLLTTLLTTREVENRVQKQQRAVDMETIVAASTQRAALTKSPNGGLASLGNLTLERQVSLEYFRVLEYVPSSSLVRAEVVLNNLSDTSVADSFVVLTAPQGRQASSTQGWVCSCSVVPEFPSAAAAEPGKARFQLELQFGPSFTFLRTRTPLVATLWLHWGASHDAPRSVTTSSKWQPSLFCIAVASVKVSPEQLLCVKSTTKPTSTSLWPQHGYEQLLFISAGSSVTSWLESQSRGETAVVARPKFALVNLNVTNRELMLYEMSQMVANLPPDVYVMHNPFQRQHLSALQRILHGIRQDIVTDESIGEKQKKAYEKGARIKSSKGEGRDRASIRRAMQKDTDQQANQLLLELQKRMNFHTMWFDSEAKD